MSSGSGALQPRRRPFVQILPLVGRDQADLDLRELLGPGPQHGAVVARELFREALRPPLQYLVVVGTQIQLRHLQASHLTAQKHKARHSNHRLHPAPSPGANLVDRELANVFGALRQLLSGDLKTVPSGSGSPKDQKSAPETGSDRRSDAQAIWQRLQPIIGLPVSVELIEHRVRLAPGDAVHRHDLAQQPFASSDVVPQHCQMGQRLVVQLASMRRLQLSLLDR
mmetsp:Transcript_63964/g.183750  ORF Transcript_63964/g.183750 Transcript_63964/m.183750 type:complete len:225 (-) Transcript_63964:541-1215(-)